MAPRLTNCKPDSTNDSWSDCGHTCGHKSSLQVYAVTSLTINGAKIMKAGSSAIHELTDSMSIGESRISEIVQRFYNYRWSVIE